jgi:putative transposase
LKEADRGEAVKELCRKHGVSEGGHYLWRAKFGGMLVLDAERLKALDAESAKLKKPLVEAMLDSEVMKEALQNNSDRTASSEAHAVDADEGSV